MKTLRFSCYIFVLLASFTFFGFNMKNKNDVYGYTIKGDSVVMFQEQKPAIIIVSNNPQCTSCINLLSNLFNNKTSNTNCLKYVITQWSSSSTERRYSIIENENLFPDFIVLFAKRNNSSYRYFSLSKSSPSIIFWDGKNIKFFENSNLFTESGSQLSINPSVLKELEICNH